MNRLGKRLLIVINSNLNDFTLANHRQFAKFTKFSTLQTLPLYDTLCSAASTHIQPYYVLLLSDNCLYSLS